jgi:hypothetical protein
VSLRRHGFDDVAERKFEKEPEQSTAKADIALAQ